MREKKSRKGLIIGVVSLLLVSVICIVGYFSLFYKKEMTNLIEKDFYITGYMYTQNIATSKPYNDDWVEEYTQYELTEQHKEYVEWVNIVSKYYKLALIADNEEECKEYLSHVDEPMMKILDTCKRYK